MRAFWFVALFLALTHASTLPEWLSSEQHPVCIPIIGSKGSLPADARLYHSLGFNHAYVSYIKTIDANPRMVVVQGQEDHQQETMMSLWKTAAGKMSLLEEAIGVTGTTFDYILLRAPDTRDLDRLVDLISVTSRDIARVVLILPVSDLLDTHKDDVRDTVTMWKGLVPDGILILECSGNILDDLPDLAKEAGADGILLSMESTNAAQLMRWLSRGVVVGLSGVSDRKGIAVAQEVKPAFFVTDNPFLCIDALSSEVKHRPHVQAAAFYGS